MKMAKDQSRSRLLQRTLEVAGTEEFCHLFMIILPSVIDLSKDQYGNYVVQKLIDFGTVSQKSSLAAQLQGQAFPLSTHSYGCRVIQKALDNLPPNQQVCIKPNSLCGSLTPSFCLSLKPCPHCTIKPVYLVPPVTFTKVISSSSDLLNIPVALLLMSTIRGLATNSSSPALYPPFVG